MEFVIRLQKATAQQTWPTIPCALLRRGAHQQEENEDEVLVNTFCYESRKSCSAHF